MTNVEVKHPLIVIEPTRKGKKSISWQPQNASSSSTPSESTRSDVGPKRSTQRSLKHGKHSDSGHSQNHLVPAYNLRASYRRKSFKTQRKSFGHSKESLKQKGFFATHVKGKLLCCSVSDESDSSANSDVDKLVKKATEEDIEERLQQAVNELGHRPTSYEIESEVLKWQKMLEIEQHNYEESGKPKFRYKWFRRNQYLMARKHPLYATNYENQRKLETRVEEFRFGASEAKKDTKEINDMKARHSYIAHAHLNYYEEAINWGSGYWSSDSHAFMANLALMISVTNFLKFPQVCYINGGFTFILTYWLLLALVGQPLLYFEMLLGQFSLNGPEGFGELHPWAVGVPYAIGFVCVVFGTSKNGLMLYSTLYALLGFILPPGECGSWKEANKCFPYEKLEEDRARLKAQRANALQGNPTSISIFSVDLFFREVMLDKDWMRKPHDTAIHWRLLIAFFVQIVIVFWLLRNSLTGNATYKYLKKTIIIPVLLLIILAHQAFFRGAFKNAVSYFLFIDFEHVKFLGIWSKAFEMVLCTLGIGYGFHWSVSGKSRFDYRKAYNASWNVCLYSALFGLLSSLVLYCEVGIVGQMITGDPNQYHVFLERLGVTFVCFSGALIKIGYDTSIVLVAFFLLLTYYAMWSQVIVTDMLFRWIDHGYIIKGTAHHHLRRTSTAVALVTFIELLILSPHFFKLGAPVLATEDVFEGYFAAYGMLLAELITVVYLYGFARFLVDVEIMTKQPLPALFQIQIRYIVIPTILLFMILMISDAYREPTLYTDHKDIGVSLYVGVAFNFSPILIILVCAQFHWLRSFVAPTNKVNPEPFRYLRSHGAWASRGGNFEQRFVAKKGAPSQSRRLTIRSGIYDMVDGNMSFIYDAQMEVKQKIHELLRFRQNQQRWLDLILGVLARKRIKSFRGLLRRIMLQQKLTHDKIDIRFLRRATDQFVYMTFYATQRKIYQLPQDQLYPCLAEELIKVTVFHEDDYKDDSESDSGSSSSESNASIASSTVSSLSHVSTTFLDTGDKELDQKYYELHKQLLGQLDKSPEEARTVLEIRMKKALGLPYKNELDVLAFLRRLRARQEREIALWNINTTMPIDHFVPASISHRGEKVAFTIFHTIVVEGSDHFVLKKLPIPRPTITRVSRRFMESQPGKTLMDKFSYVTTRKMLRNVKLIMGERDLRYWPMDKVHQHLRKVTDMIDDDVYDFLDPLLTCIIIIVPESELRGVQKHPKMYLTPPTRRHIKDIQLRRNAMMVANRSDKDYGITTFKAMTNKQIEEAKWNELLNQPPDIIFSRHSDDDDDEFQIGSHWHPDDADSSSGSQTTELEEVKDLGTLLLDRRSSVSTSSLDSSTAPITPRGGSLGKEAGRSRYILQNETLHYRDRKSLMLKGRSGDVDFGDADQLRVDLNKIRHVSARKWRRQHRKEPEWSFTRAERNLHRAIDYEAKRRGDLPTIMSRSTEFLHRFDPDLRRTISLASLQDILGADIEIEPRSEKEKRIPAPEALETLNREARLSNEKADLMYLPLGKILVVDHAFNPLVETRASMFQFPLEGEIEVNL